jgi:hypothetical protein
MTDYNCPDITYDEIARPYCPCKLGFDRECPVSDFHFCHVHLEEHPITETNFEKKIKE